LCDFCTSKRLNDIKPSDLFDNYDTDPKYKKLKALINCLAQQYGTDQPEHARWVFDKMLAHPTKERQKSFDYTPFLDRVRPVLQAIIGEIETLRGRPFPELPEITET
jgi:hypothetical protein